jgi:hypothetical protein
MKSLLLLTASGPLLVLTSHESLRDPKLLDALKGRGIGKFVAFEVPLTLAKERYGGHFQVVENDLHETDDLRVLDAFKVPFFLGDLLPRSESSTLKAEQLHCVFEEI